MMKRIAIVAIAALLLSTSATAGGNRWNKPNWNNPNKDFGWQWNNTPNWNPQNWGPPSWGPQNGGPQGWGWDDCDQPQPPKDDCEGNKPKHDKPKDCEPPTGIPSPTAAFAGLALMGTLAVRRNRKA